MLSEEFEKKVLFIGVQKMRDATPSPTSMKSQWLLQALPKRPATAKLL